jgi:hypothetical protein
MKKLLVIATAITGTLIVTLAGYAGAFQGHGHRHGSPALMACLVAAPKSVRANLKSTFSNSPLRGDWQAVQTAKQNLAAQILAKTTPLTQYENALSQAELKLIQDEDALAQSVCGQLSAAQLSAATTLYNNLQTNRKTVRGYFQAAHQAADQ